MSLESGTRFGPYEIVAAIGSGGMGEVYRARDTKLDRDVAIKILPDLFASDRDRLSRFEREAKTLASLNHPNIAQVHGAMEQPFALVMELVEGEDLSQRLARGPLPLDESLAIARQIAAALDAAHERGIVHRDLKPANIKTRDDGTVKILDFGLAKILETPNPGASPSGAAVGPMNSPTFTSPATQVGVILGTAAYMAPEQAKGRVVDKRADIWAFGAVLYEMLTGRSPFPGDSITEVLGAVVLKEPDWALLPAATPPRLRDLLRRCLEKDPNRRLRDIADAAYELSATDAAAPPQRTSTRGLWIYAAIFFAGAALASLTAFGLRAPSSQPQAPKRFAVWPLAADVRCVSVTDPLTRRQRARVSRPRHGWHRAGLRPRLSFASIARARRHGGWKESVLFRRWRVDRLLCRRRSQESGGSGWTGTNDRRRARAWRRHVDG